MGFAPSSLSDDFTDNSISTSAWVEIEQGSATAAETTGQIRFTLPSSTAGTHIARLTSRYTYDLTGDSFYINIQTMVATGVAATAFFQVYMDGINALQWVQVSNSIIARKVIASVQTDLFTATWSGTTYKYLRIRESGGNILWDSSTNGTSWTNRATLAIPFPITDLFIDFGATCANVASPGSFRLDDVNLILPALSTTWRYTQARRNLINRVKSSTVAIDTANTVQGYIITADSVDVSDNPTGNVRYWSGPAGGGRLLTEQTTEAAAQAMAVNLPLDGRFDLPVMVDLRVVRLGHRSVDGNAYMLREFYPRRLVQADDIEAESIRAIHIAAGTITVDKLDATLTITGKRIQTAYNGARVVLSGEANGGFIGYSATDTYSTTAGTGTYQVLWSLADGKFYAGAGAIQLDGAGIQSNVSTGYIGTASHRYVNTGGELIGELHGLSSTGANTNQMELKCYQTVGETQTYLILGVEGASGNTTISLRSDVSTSEIDYVATTHDFSGTLLVDGGLNVGAVTGATAGVIIARIDDAVTAGVTNAFYLRHGSSGTPAAGFGLAQFWQLETSTHVMNTAFQLNVTWATATNGSQIANANFFIYDTAARTVIATSSSGSAPKLGLLGAASIVRPTVTGSRGANAALASLLTALANLGAVTDSSTV